jgi:hypothetical protein
LVKKRQGENAGYDERRDHAPRAPGVDDKRFQRSEVNGKQEAGTRDPRYGVLDCSPQARRDQDYGKNQQPEKRVTRNS